MSDRPTWEQEREAERKKIRTWVVWSTAASVVVFALLMWLWPMYRVWQRTLAGEAQLREAEWNRQIAVREAQATLESAVHLADAEIERARGVAEANRIIAEGLGGPQGYLSYLWVQALHDDDNAVIYVPTESQLPILEATRRLIP